MKVRTESRNCLDEYTSLCEHNVKGGMILVSTEQIREESGGEGRVADADISERKNGSVPGMIWVGLTDIMTIMEMRLSTVKRMKSA